MQAEESKNYYSETHRFHLGFIADPEIGSPVCRVQASDPGYKLGSASIFCKGPDRKHCRLCGLVPVVLCCWSMEEAIDEA